MASLHQSHTPDVAAVLANTDAAIKGFIESFYKAYDRDRQRLAGYYRDHSVLIWNGNILTGTAALSEFYARMPPTIHDVQTLDCHPMPAPAMFDGPGAPPTALQLIALVSGQVRHGDAAVEEASKTTSASTRRTQGSRLGVNGVDNRVFSHQFTLREDSSSPDGYHILSECVRFV
ncbi:hypothetical protein BDF19DRAFT_441524 [Syncephalis fuscata]|nr:hypothetical protein BDF19DRAFT_441524 [Syncephalis fuscata]